MIKNFNARLYCTCWGDPEARCKWNAVLCFVFTPQLSSLRCMFCLQAQLWPQAPSSGPAFFFLTKVADVTFFPIWVVYLYWRSNRIIYFFELLLLNARSSVVQSLFCLKWSRHFGNLHLLYLCERRWDISSFPDSKDDRFNVESIILNMNRTINPLSLVCVVKPPRWCKSSSLRVCV